MAFGQRDKSTNVSLPLGALLCLLGVMQIGLASVMIVREFAFEHGAQRVVGQVIGFQRRVSAHQALVYAPIFRFSANGRSLDVASQRANYPQTWSVGERAEILFNPRQSAYVVADSWFDRWGVKSIFIAAGTVFVFAGLWIVTAHFRDRYTNPPMPQT